MAARDVDTSEIASQPVEFDTKSSQQGAMRYSRFVSAMKLLLPLGALIVLVLLIIYSGTFEDDDQLAITFTKIDSLNDDLRMVSPRISGMDAHGRPFVITADTATQTASNPNRIALDNIQAYLQMDVG